jgi:hypothetical protein
MILSRALIVACAVLAAPTASLAQTVVHPRPGVTVDPLRWQADRQRYEMDRLRYRADQREAFARQLQLETQLNRMEIEAMRRPAPDYPPPTRMLQSPEQERAFRESATERREATVSGVTQIDSWLDRPPQ